MILNTKEADDYHAKREQQERELAAASIDPSVKAIHLELAERYADLRHRNCPPLCST
jgi:hypothetical protein